MNYLTNVISIVPRLPPAIDGLGDYALNLARQLRQDFKIQTHFIVGNPTWNGAVEIEGFPVSQISDRSPDTLLTLLSGDRSCPVVLHYVGYGYAKKGCPVWLVEGLERWKANTANSHLVTMFHEVYASGLPWTSAFWSSPLQQNLAGRLLKLSDRCLTSKELYADILYQLSRGKHKEIPAMPVFSNIAEPQQVLPLAKRQRHLVIFGGSSNRLRVYRNSSTLLSQICDLIGIEKILDIGPPVDLSLSSINKSVPVVEMGQLPTAKISEIFLKSQVGFLNYNPDYLAKSGIFAAYCAHGLLPVSVQCSAFTIDEIEPGKHYWHPKNEQSIGLDNWEQLQAIADNAYTWYHTHSLSAQAKIFANYLVGKNPPGSKSFRKSCS